MLRIAATTGKANMFHQHFLSAAGTDQGPLDSGERVLWQGRCAVAEYAFDEASSLPRWTLPEETDVLVTDRRVRFTYADQTTQSNGEMFWLWPQHLRVQPGNRESGRTATVTQIQLVCNGPDSSHPALVFAGGALATVGDADRLANVMRQAIARFRVENAAEIGVPAVQARLLSRLVIGPEFNNYQGGQGQTVTLLGAVPVPGPEAAQEPAHEQPVQQQPAYERPVHEPAYEQQGYDQQAYDQQAYEPQEAPTSGSRGYHDRPGIAADAVRAEQAIRAEHDSRYAEPDLASRAATLAARVASLISSSADENDPNRATNLSAYLTPPDSTDRRR